MQDKPFVQLITGPMGAGKSTVSRSMAKQIGNCVDIDIEHINYMLPNGFDEKPRTDGSIGFNEWAMSGEIIGFLAKHFLDNDYSISIHGYVNVTLLQNIEKHVIVTSKIILMPSLETVILRDRERGEDLTMGEAWVREVYEDFEKNRLPGFIRLDTSNESIDETIARLRQQLNVAKHVL